MFCDLLSSSIQHFKNIFKDLFFGNSFFTFDIVNPLPIPLISNLVLIIAEFSKFLIIFNPSVILFDPPVKITILDALFGEYSLRDRILS